MSAHLTDMLLALAGAPSLPGARCRGRHHLFDPPEHGEWWIAVDERHTQAVGLCQHCPALARCTTWVESLPKAKRPTGVIAGTIYPRPPGRPGRPIERNTHQ